MRFAARVSSSFSSRVISAVKCFLLLVYYYWCVGFLTFAYCLALLYSDWFTGDFLKKAVVFLLDKPAHGIYFKAGCRWEMGLLRLLHP